MLYLLDANVLIDAHRDYYPLDRVPQFWDWLKDKGVDGSIKIPREQYEEVADGNDALSHWIKETDIQDALVLAEDVREDLTAKVVDVGYAPDLSDSDIEKIGKDPFLIAYALANPDDRCVVTTEVSKPSKQGANRRIPDICSGFGIRSINTFILTRELDFRISST